MIHDGRGKSIGVLLVFVLMFVFICAASFDVEART